MAISVKRLKEIIADLPDEGKVLYKDPNFTGTYYIEPEEYRFEVVEKDLLIGFPFEDAVD